jgi:ribosomal protein S18 acetylase RimI-like enzyme
MLYRLYRPEDFPQLDAIEQACFEPPFRFSRRSMRHHVSSSYAATWIAEEDGQMAGFAIVEWNQEPDEVIAYVQTIEVAPKRRCFGIGRELISRIEGSARAAGACMIWLHVEVANAGAIQLYEAHGYRCEGREENYYPRGRSAFIYGKRLE